ncbi:MAG: ATP-binding protein [Archangium sp.]|nr:ATP-binding protein [Archangium sp.]
MFVGRTQEIGLLESALLQTKLENPKHFALVGERGIGKSSLLFFLDHVARGSIKAGDGTEYNFLTLNLIVDPKDTPSSLVGRVALELKRQLKEVVTAKERFKRVFEFVTRWEAAGIKYKKASSEDADTIEDLADALLDFLKNSFATHSGVLLLIDEADKAVDAELGVFSKTLTERISRSDHNRFCLGLAGLPEVADVLKDSHESAPRIFETIELTTLSESECDYVIDAGIRRAKEKASLELTFTEDARGAIATVADGYPHFIQQFAYSSVDASDDDIIDLKDFNLGSFGIAGNTKKSAIHQLGQKYFAAPVLEEIYSNDYRTLLRTMADNLDEWVDRATLLEKSGLRDTQLNNALSTLKTRKLIMPKKGEKGVYRLPTKSFAIWLKAILANKYVRVGEPVE